MCKGGAEYSEAEKGVEEENRENGSGAEKSEMEIEKEKSNCVADIPDDSGRVEKICKQ